MLSIYRRTGMIDLAGSVALGVLHTGLAVSYGVPGLAVVATPPTPGRVSVVNYLDQLGPVWIGVFGLTALALLFAVARPWWLMTAHSLAMGGMAIFTAAVWFGYAVSDPKPSIITALFATAVVLWHLVLLVTYRAAGSLPVRAGGPAARHGKA